MVAGLVVVVIGYVSVKRATLSQIPTDLTQLQSRLNLNIPDVLGSFKQLDVKSLGNQTSNALDALVTQPGRNIGQVVLGVQVTNESIGAITDVLSKLPNPQLEQIRAAICASPSAR
ncbi:MAG: hypothetical protein UY20_C0014G0002 [Candidatus Yanofskybacteria bacterium GW2011_GWA1_48_10]|uniref:Uncharacterized protein n=1 Tax=Candidatus Yanofskybacteria bacterium GW2011_GWA1_48_10 TaxID=1619022 RepID=A0A0G1U5D7_9BACT|nr:MAG: hypothetical protein UY20_C0014G0002 [Candidatus Yanofskybacteria bacterium GW2011_GWA1_48_10]